MAPISFPHSLFTLYENFDYIKIHSIFILEITMLKGVESSRTA